MKPNGDPPPSLQEHTAVTFRDNIYVFGGELGFSGGVETPLWVYESRVKMNQLICTVYTFIYLKFFKISTVDIFIFCYCQTIIFKYLKNTLYVF